MTGPPSVGWRTPQPDDGNLEPPSSTAPAPSHPTWARTRPTSRGLDRLHPHLGHQRHPLARLDRVLRIGGVAVEAAFLHALHDRGEAEEGEGEAELPDRNAGDAD